MENKTSFLQLFLKLCGKIKNIDKKYIVYGIIQSFSARSINCDASNLIADHI